MRTTPNKSEAERSPPKGANTAHPDIAAATVQDTLAALHVNPGALASQEANQDPIDLAFLAAANERHIFDSLPKVTPVSFAPFDAKNRRTEAVVEQGRTIYQRILTWIVNKISRTILKAADYEVAALEGK